MTLHSHAKKPKSGTWLVSCDVCGIIHLNTQIKKRWDNLYVCESDWERDHPQKNIKLPRERIAAPFERVESVDGTDNSFIPLCTIFSNQAVAGAAEAGCSVAGTWRLQDQGGSLLAPPPSSGPPPPPPPVYYNPASLLYYFNGEGPTNVTLTNQAPSYVGVYDQLYSPKPGVTNSTGYFGSGITWPTELVNRMAWQPITSGVNPIPVNMDILNFTFSFWYFSPSVGITGRGGNIMVLGSIMNFQITNSVSPPDVNTFIVNCSFWTNGSSASIITPVELVGWNRFWVVCIDGLLTIYMNSVQIFQVQKESRFSPYIRSITTPMTLMDTGTNYASGRLDEVVFLKDIGMEPTSLSDPFPVITVPIPPPVISKRYWRFRNLTIPGGGFLEISELRFTVSGTDTNTAIVTSSSTPAFGNASELFDNNLTSRCYWTEAVAENAAFWIQYDFGKTTEVTGFKQGGFDTSTRYISSCSAEYSSDAVTWTLFGTASGLTYPGNNTLSSNILFVPSNAQPFIHWRILVSNNDGDATYTSIGEVELLVGGSDITGSVTSSGQSTANGGGETAAQTIDNNPNTEWVTSAGNALPSWVAYSFASAVTPTQLSIRSQRVVSGRTPTTFKLQGNDTGRGPSDPWVDVLNVTGSTGWGIQETRVFNI